MRSKNWFTTSEWRQDMLALAAREGVSLKVETGEISPDKITSSEKIDSRAVAKIISSMCKYGWRGPHLIVTEWDGPYGLEINLFNGNHRLRAALLVDLPFVPIAIINEAASEFFDRNDIDRVSAEELLQETSPEISIRSSGSEKRRTTW